MSNFSEIVLMSHVALGMMCILGGLWVFVDTLNVRETNLPRIRGVSLAVAVFMWAAFLVGGYWYVVHYAPDKAIILKGPWPFAHSFFMEMKEHVILMLLLLATYLPIIAFQNLSANGKARKTALLVAGLIVLIGFAMDGSGALIGMGAKLGAMPH